MEEEMSSWRRRQVVIDAQSQASEPGCEEGQRVMTVGKFNTRSDLMPGLDGVPGERSVSFHAHRRKVEVDQSMVLSTDNYNIIHHG